MYKIARGLGIGVLAASLLSACGGEETVDIEGEALNYGELKWELTSINQEISEAEVELETVNQELQDNKERFEGLEELADNRDQLEEEVNESEATLEELENELESIQEEIDKAEGKLVEVQDEPISVNAGYFYFGDDIEPGRYKITAQEGQRGNVFIRRNDRSYVNEIFGDGSNRTTKEFTFKAEEADELEATIPVLLYPIKE